MNIPLIQLNFRSPKVGEHFSYSVKLTKVRYENYCPKQCFFKIFFSNEKDISSKQIQPVSKHERDVVEWYMPELGLQNKEQLYNKCVIMYLTPQVKMLQSDWLRAGQHLIYHFLVSHHLTVMMTAVHMVLFTCII